MRVFIPSALYSYTAGAVEAQADGATVDAALRDLDRQFPGLRFRVIDEQDRVRQHMRVFVNRDFVRELTQPVAAGDELYIIMALSGGYAD